MGPNPNERYPQGIGTSIAMKGKTKQEDPSWAIHGFRKRMTHDAPTIWARSFWPFQPT